MWARILPIQSNLARQGEITEINIVFERDFQQDF